MQHTTVKRVTFHPLSGGRYRCNQTGKVVTQREILSYINQVLGGNTTVAIGRETQSPPKKKTNGSSSHPSKYRAKKR